MRKLKVFSGSSHPELASSIVERLGLAASLITFKQFSNHEISVEIGISVRGSDVFIIQSGSDSVNDHLMELLSTINACRSASAMRITAIMPYFPYSKQSKKKSMRGSITAKLVANMLAIAGVDHVITMDLHSSLIQGFFHRPVDNLFAEPYIARYIRDNIEYENAVVVSKNAGGAKRVTSLADRLKIDFALIHKDSRKKQSTLSAANSVESIRSSSNVVMVVDSHSPRLSLHTATKPQQEMKLDGGSSDELTLIGDVQGRTCFILDDMIDGTQSFIQAAVFLRRMKATKVYIVATHGILSGDGLADIQHTEQIDGVIVTNTYPIPAWKRELTEKLVIIDVSSVFAEAIRRTHNGESISYLFDTAV